MNILTLRLWSNGFSGLAAGQVSRKYRPCTPYGQKSLFDANGQPKPFDAVHIKNGYRADAPLAIYALKGVSTQVEEHEGQPCYRIDLGAMIEIRP